MSATSKKLFLIAILLAGVISAASPARALKINDKFAVNGLLAGAYQYLDASGSPEDSHLGRGSAPLQIELSFTPTGKDELFAKLGFAAGNGIHTTSPFKLSPWAASQEDDVKDINGTGRDYLLTAWYKHTFSWGQKHSLSLSAGLIDSTDYVDQNTYSNDEYTQFMNEALVNGPNGFAPSYDQGAALEWQYGPYSLNGVFMHVHQNDEGNDFNYYALQAAYTLNTPWGQGNYRLIYQGAGSEFHSASGSGLEPRHILLVSFDQELGKILGAWIRMGSQTSDAMVSYANIYTGGINISGKLWGRAADNIGLAGGYLDGGNEDVANTRVAEAYLRLALNDHLALTFDAQYMRDEYLGAQEDVSGFIFGVRGTLTF